MIILEFLASKRSITTQINFQCPNYFFEHFIFFHAIRRSCFLEYSPFPFSEMKKKKHDKKYQVNSYRG